METIKENIEYFLQHGQFEHVHLGISRKELINLLGETNWCYPEKSKYPRIYKYSYIEFHFSSKDKDAELIGMSYTTATMPADNSPLELSIGQWTNELTHIQAEEMLKTLNISYESNVYKHDYDAWCINTTSGVFILFAKDGKEYKLEKLWVFN